MIEDTSKYSYEEYLDALRELEGHSDYKMILDLRTPKCHFIAVNFNKYQLDLLNFVREINILKNVSYADLHRILYIAKKYDHEFALGGGGGWYGFIVELSRIIKKSTEYHILKLYRKWSYIGRETWGWNDSEITTFSEFVIDFKIKV